MLPSIPAASGDADDGRAGFPPAYPGGRLFGHATLASGGGGKLAAPLFPDRCIPAVASRSWPLPALLCISQQGYPARCKFAKTCHFDKIANHSKASDGMDLAVLPSAAGSASPDPQAALQQAVDDFRGILTDQQRRKLSQLGAICDADTVFIFMSQLDHENRAVRPGVASRFYSVLRCVQTFSSVVETFVASHPEIAALVWGSFKMTMLIAVNFTSYFEALSSLFMTVKNQCPLFAEYQALYPTSTRLQTALCDFHAAIIRCCKHVVEVLQRSWTQLLKKAIFQSFQDEMKADMQSIQTKGADVKEEIFLAAARAQRDDEALQGKERKVASQIGSGKSVLWFVFRLCPVFQCSLRRGSSNVVNHIFRNKGRDEQASFFFVERGKSESLEAETMIRSLIRQFIDPKAMPEYVYNELCRLDRAIFIKLDTWIDLLREIVQQPTTFYIIIDGLDECETVERREILHALSLFATAASNLRVFLSSRDSVHLDLGGGSLNMQRISMAGDCLTADIRSYVEQSIQERLQREELAFGDTELLAEVNDALTLHADGMFLWVTFLIDEICAANCDDEVRQSLRRLPKNLEETFARALWRILSRSRHPELVQKAFQWVAVARRPLTLDELREAISIEIGQKSWRRERIPQNINRIVVWSENLLHLTEEEPIQVQFAHASIRDFITGEATSPQLSKFHANVAEADHFAGEICVTYLSFSDFTKSIARRQRPIHVKPADITAAVLSQEPKMAHVSGLVTKLAFGGDKPMADADLTNVVARCIKTEDRKMEELKSSHPFLKYAAKYWFPHTTRFHEKKSVTWDLWLQIMSGGSSPAEISWPGSLMQDVTQLMQWSIERQHYALTRYACGSDEHARFTVKNVMMSLVVDDNTEDLAIWLRAADWSSYCLNDLFQIACVFGQRRAAELLLDFGAEVSFECDGSEESHVLICGTALQAASRGGNVDMIDWLLGAGADLQADKAGSHHYTALQEASSHGYLEAVERLLAAGADVNAAPSKNGQTAIQGASRGGHVGVVERLLAAGAEVNIVAARWNGLTALTAASQRGHLGVVKLLLNAGADVNDASSTRDETCTALQIAASAGYADVVDELLAAGADIDAPSRDGRTALDFARGEEYLAILGSVVPSENAPAAWGKRKTGRGIKKDLITGSPLHTGHLCKSGFMR
ncbi:Ankyrin repeat-containing domain protein [Cordyceps fumosorosea ARSEF 2679]|uniref:Ankyrin repeat-containing domain protein n=1 Tax=Cordyceps fumosorosea (strain ARSEF 2679) TaxID=1081104 RepID=A0A167N638_CORFA|nr:Ankyrin repeat-containing domain protein [Cordyceps fumosorosea ARSEF 2679]OAA55172.1 Ankyrin repeat-containing domain protein [Cordyceps fumosorosea ARSEF 2679]